VRVLPGRSWSLVSGGRPSLLFTARWMQAGHSAMAGLYMPGCSPYQFVWCIYIHGQADCKVDLSRGRGGLEVTSNALLGICVVNKICRIVRSHCWKDELTAFNVPVNPTEKFWVISSHCFYTCYKLLSSHVVEQCAGRIPECLHLFRWHQGCIAQNIKWA
jgi:hypothetical protein